jgi:ABC-2 type transport system ATP-binding protein
MNTHILSDVEMVCDRVAIIVGGRIRYEGAIDEFLTAGQPEADLVLAHMAPEIAQVMEERFAARLRGHGEQIELRIAEKDTNAVLQLVLEAGAEVISVTPHRVSLESIFLSAVEQGAAAEQAHGEGQG